MKSSTLRMLAAALGLAALGAGVGAYTARYYAPEPPAVSGLLWPDPKQVGAFRAVDEEGRPFGLDRMQGRWSFLFFGYTNCPDICPITLAVLDRVHRQLEAGGGGSDVQTVFVSVDPERDTQERLKQYVEYFNADFTGVGGTLAEVQSLTGQLGVPFVHEAPAAGGQYLVDHSAAVFLVDPEARLVSVFSPPHTAEDILARFREVRRFIEDAES